MRILPLLIVAALALARPRLSAAAPKPNIIYVLCDDLGYGDVKCLNADGKIATPHCDRLAAEGMIFTAAEDSVSVLPAFEGRAAQSLREAVVHHSINGSFAIRQGNWKLEPCADSGGWSAPKPGPPQPNTPPVHLRSAPAP